MAGTPQAIAAAADRGGLAVTIDLCLTADPETPLTTLLHPFDFYDLALAFEDAGLAIKWDQVLALETCGQVQELMACAV